MTLNALFTGASGLQANSTALDVVGNNLANLNTTGYKTQRTLFRDQVYQLLEAGSAGNGSNVGGTNSAQLGGGVNTGAIDTQFTQGSVTPTGNDYDAAIQGNGFFVVRSGTTQEYTRAGNFNVDANGYLVSATGERVQRTGSVGEGSATQPAFQTVGNNDIRVPIGSGVPGTATTTAALGGNIDSNTAVGGTVASNAITVYDSQGGSRNLTVSFTKTADNTYDLSAAIPGATVTLPATSVTFDANGRLVSPGTVALNITGLGGAGPQTVTLNLGTPGTAIGLGQQSSGSSVRADGQDGSTSGTITSAFIDNSGTLQGRSTNGQTIALAQLGVATFNNDGGLIRSGNNNFASGPGSGDPLIGPAGSGGRGTVSGQSLEGAGVDIAVEFSRLIIAQRGFQVNARTISAANDTLQELANIIR